MSNDVQPASTAEETPEPPRRGFFMQAVAACLGVLFFLVPFASGIVVYLDPLRKRERSKPDSEETPTEGGPQAGFLFVANLQEIPEDGTPRRFPIEAEKVDAWNRFDNVRIGAVYLRREGENVIAFSAVCPHAGCFVEFKEAREQYECPCHNAIFSVEGERDDPKHSVSPRNMDKLKVDETLLAQASEVWVQYLQFQAGKKDRIEIQ
ncbi:Rieske domain-containing protein [Planctomycetales bacterium 10988]|nr:Rieske domain-containing protein [Planctomycetales bacterium 10988]